MTAAVEWRPVSGWPYEISRDGEVCSVDRVIVRRDGRRLRLRGQPIQPCLNRQGCWYVVLHHEGRQRKFSVAKLIRDVFGITADQALMNV